VSAQGTGTALVRFGNFSNSEDQVELYWQSLLRDVNFAPNVMTPYMPAEAGEQTFSFAPLGEGATEDIIPATETVVIQEGHTYTVVVTSLESPPYIVDETGLDGEAPLAEGENRLIIVTQAATDDGAAAASFKIADNTSPTPTDRPMFEYNYYVASTIGTNGVVVERLDPQTQEPTYRLNIPYLPNTNVIINGDWTGVPDEDGEGVPLILNLSTDLSVADWLAQVNQMPNPPFTFNHFVETATTGGFYAALQQCENYMWNVWTDAAFGSLTPDQQAAVSSGMGAAAVMDNSVLQPATTTPWAISPTTTRGGTPLIYFNPFVPEANPEPVAVGNVLLSITTTGNDVQNVINIVDVLPVGDSDVTPSGINYRFHSDIDEAFLGG
jgi:hypothetical protein